MCGNEGKKMRNKKTKRMEKRGNKDRKSEVGMEIREKREEERRRNEIRK